MKRSSIICTLLAGSALFISTAALAQEPEPQPDPSDATADATIAQARELDEAQAKLELLQAQIEALQQSIAQIQTEQAKKITPALEKASWSQSTKISGKAFLNISNISQKTDGADTSQNGLQTELKRFYIGVDHQFDDTFSANLTTDFRYNANGTSKDVLVYVKKAYVQAKFAPELFVRVGAADLPWVPFVEDLYGYRFVENVLIDRTKYGTSADWGVHVGGSTKDGLLSYAFSAVNGAGYKTLSRSSDTIDLEGRISLKPIKEVVLAVGGYTGKLGKSSDNLPDSATPHRATRFNALAAYVGPRARFGVEYFAAKNWNNVTTPFTDKTSGWSVFGSFAFDPKLSVFGRFDILNPNKDTNEPLKEHYFNLGLNYTPVKNIDLALVYKRDKAENGIVSTSNGNIGGVADGTYDEFGVWSQVKF